MATDQGPVVQSALLRSELIRLRKESGLTQEQVAEDLDWSPSKLIRVEGGRSSITKVDLDALLTTYGISSESHRERLQALNRGRASEPGGPPTGTRSTLRTSTTLVTRRGQPSSGSFTGVPCLACCKRLSTQRC